MVRTLRTLTAATAAVAFTALLATSASALPAGSVQQPPAASETIQVRDGCGRGMRYSNRRDRCVRSNDDRRGNDAGRAINRMFNQAIGGGSQRRGRDVCGRGFRFSHNRGRCVRD